MPFDRTNFPMEVEAPVIETEAQRLLRGAAEIIETPGRWTTRRLINPDKAVCLFGAVHLSAGVSARALWAHANGIIPSEPHEIQGGCEATALCEPFIAAAVAEREGPCAGEDDGSWVGSVAWWNDKQKDHMVVASVLRRAYELAGEAR